MRHGTDASRRDLVLKEQGCFIVPAIADGRSGHLFVEYMVPASPEAKVPVVMLHGGSQSGCCYRATPDGRAGWQEHFVRAGHPVYVVDLPGSGRAANQPFEMPLRHLPAASIEQLYTRSAASCMWPASAGHDQWPGEGVRGDAAFEQFLLTQYGSLIEKTPALAMHVACCAALLKKIGRCVVLAHSLGATAMWPLAQRCPELLAALIAVEPNGPPFSDIAPVGDGTTVSRDWGISYVPLQFDPPIESPLRLLEIWNQKSVTPHRLVAMQSVPVLVVTGSASYHAAYDAQTVEFLRRFGAKVEHMELGAHGLSGNGHMLMLESNSDEIAALIASWLRNAA